MHGQYVVSRKFGQLRQPPEIPSRWRDCSAKLNPRSSAPLSPTDVRDLSYDKRGRRDERQRSSRLATTARSGSRAAPIDFARRPSAGTNGQCWLGHTPGDATPHLNQSRRRWQSATGDPTRARCRRSVSGRRHVCRIERRWLGRTGSSGHCAGGESVTVAAVASWHRLCP